MLWCLDLCNIDNIDDNNDNKIMFIYFTQKKNLRKDFHVKCTWIKNKGITFQAVSVIVSVATCWL